MKNLKQQVQESVYENVYEQILLQGSEIIFYQIRQQIWSRIGILVCEQHYEYVCVQVILNEKS